jgi:hypothetical protein
MLVAVPAMCRAVRNSYPGSLRLRGHTEQSRSQLLLTRRLVYTWDWEEEAHAVGETLVTVDLEAVGNSTQLTFTHERFPNAEAAGEHEQGWGSCLNRLEGILK